MFYYFTLQTLFILNLYSFYSILNISILILKVTACMLKIQLLYNNTIIIAYLVYAQVLNKYWPECDS
jgi:hypothetical protein